MFGIYWDCDGTIMDTEKSYAYAWKDFLSSKGLENRDILNKSAKNETLPDPSIQIDLLNRFEQISTHNLINQSINHKKNLKELP